jgi:DNA-binding response OmpR family regulator
MDELVAIINWLERKILIKDEADVWKLNQIRWEIESPKHLEIELTKSEFSLLNVFVGKPGAVINRDEIIRSLGFNPIDYDNRRLEVMLRRLRKKIEDAGVVKFPLQTVYGVGLAFTEKLKFS